MKTLKLLRPWVAECYLIVSVLYYWIMTGTILNPVAMVLLLILTSLVIFKNKALGVSISIVFLLLNLYMVLAMISELNEFESFNQRAMELLIFGSLYFGLNIVVSIVMIMKWGRITPQPEQPHST
jgi:hypothetical protein